ncbi:MAG TPA: peptidyl-prolyl cis-trans isomerase [Armatimonadota bacterium]|nr:peptidyl-prolyl cis-trans isomerase [Armatimonadota bacterium]
MRVPVLVTLVLLLPLPCVAQGAKKPAAAPGKAAAPKPTGPDLPSKVPGGLPFCVVNGEAVSLEAYVDRLSIAFGPQVREALIEEALIRQEAKRRKVLVTQAEINAAAAQAYTATVRQYGDEKKLAEDLLKSRGWTPADYKSVIRAQTEHQVLRRKLAASLVKADAVTDKQVEERYTEQRAAFTQPETVKISHILVRRPEEGEGGADFAQVARESSDDKITGKGGGEIPTPIGRGANPFGAAFEAAVYGAPVGLVGQVVVTPLGYHVIRVDSTQEGRTPPLAEVREQIRTALLAEKRDEALGELFVRLRTNAKIETGKF